MATEIQDGTGSGKRVKIDSDQRMHIQSLSIPYETFEVLDGNSFAITSGVQTLTTDTRSDLLYFQNDGEEDIVIALTQIDLGTSTGGASKDWEFYFIISPTIGTLAGALAVINNNTTSAKTLSISGATGVEGSAVTGGVPVTFLLQGEGTRERESKVVLPKNASIGIGLKPPTGNTSVKALIGITLIKQTLDINGNI